LFFDEFPGIPAFPDGDTHPDRFPDAQIKNFPESDNIRLAFGINGNYQSGRSRENRAVSVSGYLGVHLNASGSVIYL
jgi:hypothetical protein